MAKNIYHDFYRQHKPALLNLPIAVLHCGHYIFQPLQKAKVKMRDFVQVIWTFEGMGHVCIDRQWLALAKRSAAILYPGRHEFKADTKGEWEFYTLALEGKFILPIAEQLQLQPGVYGERDIAGLDFRAIQEALSTVGTEGEQAASHLAYKLLVQISCPSKTFDDNVVSQSLELIKNSWNSPDLTIAEIAKRLDIHRSTLCRRFQVAVGVTPIDYIANMRLQQAISFLRSSNYTIAQIAYKCGFNDPDYFSRFFKKQTGLYPREFREAKAEQSLYY